MAQPSGETAGGEKPRLVCDLSAFTPEEREVHGRVAGELLGAVRETRELANGYAFRLDGDGPTLGRLAEFVDLERRCCPFLAFRLDIAPAQGPIWLRLSGPDGVKPFLRAELNLSAR